MTDFYTAKVNIGTVPDSSPMVLVNSAQGDRLVVITTSRVGFSIGFTSAEVANAGDGYPLPATEFRLPLPSKEELWIREDVSGVTSVDVEVLVTGPSS